MEGDAHSKQAVERGVEVVGHVGNGLPWDQSMGGMTKAPVAHGDTLKILF